MDALVDDRADEALRPRETPVHRPGRRPPADVRALDDLSIAVREGEIFGFLGPNGAGKSTTIRLLLGFLHPTAGSAPRCSATTSSGTASRSARQVGYLPGGIALYDALTGERLLDYLAAPDGPAVGRRAELLDRLELSARTLQPAGPRLLPRHAPEDRHHPGAPARPRAGDPRRADRRPRSADAARVLRDPRRPPAAGRTIFFSSHVLSEVERVCDRVAIVRRGRLVALEDVARLLARRKRQRRAARRRRRRPALDGVAGRQRVAGPPTAGSRASSRATSGRSSPRSPGTASPT